MCLLVTFQYAKYVIFQYENNWRWKVYGRQLPIAFGFGKEQVALLVCYFRYPCYILCNISMYDYMQGDQTTDVSKTNTAFPYIINFCNLTQVRNSTGYVRSIRRVQQAPYPLIKVQPEELQSVVAGILIAT